MSSTQSSTQLRQKLCPVCRTPAPVQAQFCGTCKHQFRTPAPVPVNPGVPVRSGPPGLCSDCGQPISHSAQVCPHCGAVTETSKSSLPFVGIILMVLSIVGQVMSAGAVAMDHSQNLLLGLEGIVIGAACWVVGTIQNNR